MRNFVLTLFLTILIFNTYGQEDHLFIPKEIKQAYENNTRSYDGTPGETYWQNTVDYEIDVEVFPESSELKGTAKITYHNNSPDSLYKLILRNNHYTNRGESESDTKGGREISRLTYNGFNINLSEEVARGVTNIHIQLPEVIPPKTKANLVVDWSMQIEQTTDKDSTSFFLTNWYPELAVYDDIFGWDEELPQARRAIQLYRNLGDYDIRIKAPEAFTVVASGELQNAAEVLPLSIYERYERAKKSDDAVTIISSEDIKNDYNNKSNTWNYQASEITNFAFGLSKHYAWNGAKLDVGDRDVFITTFYDVSHEEEPEEMINQQRKHIKHFSENMPGIPFPFPEFTSFIIGSGGATGAAMIERLWGTDMHNMLHQYIPRYVRINEKHFAWMDEGILDFTTTYLNRKFYQKDQGLIIEGYDYVSVIGSVEDLPIMASSRYMDNTKNAQAPIKLTKFIFAMLYHELGHEMFTESFRTFIKTWAKKSPTPYDLFNIFEKTSGQDLDWFWNPWFFRLGDVDISISSLENGNLRVENKGTKPVALVVNVTYKDGSTWMDHFKASVWKDNDQVVVNIPDHDKIKMVDVNNGVPDTDIFNNYYPSLIERYGEFKIDGKFLGTYSLDKIPVTVSLQEKDGLVYMTIHSSGVETYLLPTGNNTFKDLGNEYGISLIQKEDGSIGIILEVKPLNKSFTGEKK